MNTRTDATTPDVDPFDAPATPDTIVWIAGHNLTGYLPESTPSHYLTAVSALQCLRTDLDSLADHYAMTEDTASVDTDVYATDGAETCIDAITDIEAVLDRFTDPSLREEAAADYITSGGADFYIEHEHYWTERRTLGELLPDDRANGSYVWADPVISHGDVCVMGRRVTVGEVLDYLNEA